MTQPDSSADLARPLRELVGLYLQRQRQHIHEQGLPAQGRLLMLLQKHGPATQSEFGRLAGLDKSWVSRVVDRFVADGLIERLPLESDRRCLQLLLTPAGEALATQVSTQLDAHAAHLLAGLPAKSRPGVAAAIAALISTIQAQEARDE